MKIGLTGGIGCGKSTALQILNDAGAGTIETDSIVRSLLSTDKEVRSILCRRWGDKVLDSNGVLDRGAIANIVFSNATELEFLESILHPRTRKVWVSQIEEEPTRTWVVEIPLLFEKNLEGRFDVTVCIAADEAIWRTRLQDRGLSGSEIVKRLARQLPLSEKIERADYVIHNNGSREFLRRQLQTLLSQLHTNHHSTQRTRSLSN